MLILQFPRTAETLPQNFWSRRYSIALKRRKSRSQRHSAIRGSVFSEQTVGCVRLFTPDPDRAGRAAIWCKQQSNYTTRIHMNTHEYTCTELGRVDVNPAARHVWCQQSSRLIGFIRSNRCIVTQTLLTRQRVCTFAYCHPQTFLRFRMFIRWSVQRIRAFTRQRRIHWRWRIRTFVGCSHSAAAYSHESHVTRLHRWVVYARAPCQVIFDRHGDMQQISVFMCLHDECIRVKFCVFKKFHFGHRSYFSPDRSPVFGLIMRCRVNARPIHKNILPYSPLALSCKQGLNVRKSLACAS